MKLEPFELEILLLIGVLVIGLIFGPALAPELDPTALRLGMVFCVVMGFLLSGGKRT